MNVDIPRELLSKSAASRATGATTRAVAEGRQALEAGHGDVQLEYLALEAIGSAMWSRGEVRHAALVLGAADSLRERTHQEGPGPLDELAAGTPGWEEGRTLTVDEVLNWLQTGRNTRGNPTSGPSSLTASERAVAELAAEGLTNPAIARRLYVSPNTVKTHLLRAYRKLGVSGRNDLARALSPRD